MKDDKDLLQRLYDTTINQIDPWYFFLNLADYVKFVRDTNPFKEIIEPLQKHKVVLLEEIEEYEKKAVSELMASKKKLEKLVGKVKGLKEKLKKTGFFSDGFTSIDQYLEGGIHTSGTDSDIISRFLYEVSWDITGQGQDNLLEDFTVSPKGQHREVKFSQSLAKRQDLNFNLNIQRQITPWGYWDLLCIPTYNDIFVWSEWTSQLPKVDQTFLSEFVSIKHEVQENKPPENTFPRIERKTSMSTRESRVPVYKHYLERMHIYLLKEANNSQSNDSKIEVSFDLNKSVLTINDKQVIIRKTSKQFEIIRVIFTDRKKEWQLSELAEQIDKYDDKWKNLYNSINAIETKISSDTGIKDFFVTTTQSVAINKHYLR